MAEKLAKGYEFENKPHQSTPAVSSPAWGIAKPPESLDWYQMKESERTEFVEKHGASAAKALISESMWRRNNPGKAATPAAALDWYSLTPQERYEYVSTHSMVAAENFVAASRKRRGYACTEPPAYELDWSALSPSDHVAFVRRYGTQAAKDCAARSITAAAKPSASPAKKKLPLLVLPAGRFVQAVPMHGEEEAEAPAKGKGQRKQKPADRPHGSAAVALGRFFSLDHGGEDEEEDG